MALMKTTKCRPPSWLMKGLLCLYVGGSSLLGKPVDAQTDSGSSVTANATFEESRVVPLPVQQYGYRGSMGDIIALKDGRLMAVYGPPMAGSLQPSGKILARFSSDKGKTWGEDSILVQSPQPPGGKDTYMLPGLIRLANGDILLSYMYIGREEPYFYAPAFYRRSIDEGQTWGDQLLITPAADSSLLHNDKLVQLRNGRLIAPTAHQVEKGENDHRGFVSSAFYSDDNGRSWRKSENEVSLLPVEAQEPHAVELTDGRIMMLMRTYNRYVARAYSADQGITWSKGEPVPELTLSPNSSAINVARIPRTGDLLLVRTTAGEQGRRSPFVSVISQDDGKTWTNERVIGGDSQDDYGYPSVTFLDDLALVFYHKRDGLWLARIGIDWFYGK